MVLLIVLRSPAIGERFACNEVNAAISPSDGRGTLEMAIGTGVGHSLGIVGTGADGGEALVAGWTAFGKTLEHLRDGHGMSHDDLAHKLNTLPQPFLGGRYTDGQLAGHLQTIETASLSDPWPLGCERDDLVEALDECLPRAYSLRYRLTVATYIDILARDAPDHGYV